MKAWIVRERDEFSATIVFAESRGQAKTVALKLSAAEELRYENNENKMYN